MGGSPDWATKFPKSCTLDTAKTYKPCAWWCDKQSCDQCHPNNNGCEFILFFSACACRAFVWTLKRCCCATVNVRHPDGFSHEEGAWPVEMVTCTRRVPAEINHNQNHQVYVFIVNECSSTSTVSRLPCNSTLARAATRGASKVFRHVAAAAGPGGPRAREEFTLSRLGLLRWSTAVAIISLGRRRTAGFLTP